MQYPKSGPNLVSEYQVSGLPFALVGSGSQQIEFPYLTKFFLIKSIGDPISVAFTAEGLTNNYHFTVLPSTSVGPLEIRVKDLFVSGASWELVAGLTMVERRMWPTLTASAAPENNPPGSNLSEFGYIPGL